MSGDKRGNRTQEVVGSIPISSTTSNGFRNNNFTVLLAVCVTRPLVRHVPSEALRGSTSCTRRPPNGAVSSTNDPL
jgi:hypothetical protein